MGATPMATDEIWCRNGLRSVALFATEVYRSDGLIRIDGVRNERIIGGNELCWKSFYLVKRNDERTL